MAIDFSSEMQRQYNAMMSTTDPVLKGLVTNALNGISDEKIKKAIEFQEQYQFANYLSHYGDNEEYETNINKLEYYNTIKIDPFFLFALSCVESGSNVWTTKDNGVGFTGIMQTPVSCYRGENSLIAESSTNSSNRIASGNHNAKIGIKIGSSYVRGKQYFFRVNSGNNFVFPFNPFLVATAYNGGEGNVEKGINSLGLKFTVNDSTISTLLWTEAIEPIAQAAKAMWPNSNKFNEVGEFFPKVCIAYMKLKGFNVEFSGLSEETHLGGFQFVANNLLNNLSSQEKTINNLADRPSDTGFEVTQMPHGKHSDSIIKKLPIGKTYCEPVYPDLITVSDKIPQWVMNAVNIDTTNLSRDSNYAFAVPTEQLKELLGAEADSILGISDEIASRQRIFDPSKYKEEFKALNPGKPPNNTTPFPVDTKIEELELHSPTVKVHTIKCCPEAVSTARAAIQISDAAEKRIVRLENMMATMMRYLFRLSSRINVNCVYYGGQTPFEKYNCIRCMHQDRITDGQTMSLDQCLTCTRYEPIDGQVYEIINEHGINLQSILDDQQMSYTNMEDYVTFTSIDKQHTERPNATLDLTKVKERSSGELDFKELWGTEGIGVSWELVPVELQKPHINWRQSILDDGSSLEKQDSYQNSLYNYGKNITSLTGNANIMQKNADAMNSNTNEVLTDAIEIGQSKVSVITDNFINKLRSGLEDTIKNTLSNNSVSIDPGIIAAIMAVENSSDVSAIVKKYLTTQTELGGITNPAVVITAYKNGAIYITGDKTSETKTGILRIDEVTKEDTTGSGESTSQTFGLNYNHIENWLWPDFAEPYMINCSGKKSRYDSKSYAFFPSVCYVYLELMKYMRKSFLDGETFAFPFTENQLPGVWYVSKYGMRQLSYESSARMHEGIDLATGIEGAGMQIHAIADGTVVDRGGWGCNSITVQHANNYYSRYLHCQSHCVNVGAVVKKGDIIATVGDVGSAGAYHLHLEIGQGDALSQRSQYDPCSFYPGLASLFGDSPSPPIGQAKLSLN